MKRAIALLIALLAGSPALAPVAAGASDVRGACFISGTVTFSEGAWDIAPGVIDCQGLGYGWERIVGRGSFTGSGSYTGAPGPEHCVPQLGTGEVDYWIPTTERDVHLVEEPVFTPAGAGVFTTPSLRGTFQILHYDGNCVTTASGLFLAEVSLLKGATRV